MISDLPPASPKRLASTVGAKSREMGFAAVVFRALQEQQAEGSRNSVHHRGSPSQPPPAHPRVGLAC